MDISPARRRLLFGLIVCVLVGLGAYLLGPIAHGAGRSGALHAATTTPRPAASHTARPGTATTSAVGQPDIYQWLPFTQAGLAAAASVVVRFGDAYGSYSYTQNAAAYAAPLTPITAAQLVGQIEAAYSAPGVAAARVSGKQVAVGTATIGIDPCVRAEQPDVPGPGRPAAHRHDRPQSAEHRLRGDGHRLGHDVAGHRRRAGSPQVTRDQLARPRRCGRHRRARADRGAGWSWPGVRGSAAAHGRAAGADGDVREQRPAGRERHVLHDRRQGHGDDRPACRQLVSAQFDTGELPGAVPVHRRAVQGPVGDPGRHRQGRE